jgi:hypothetical protein
MNGWMNGGWNNKKKRGAHNKKVTSVVEGSIATDETEEPRF